ncbi:MAG: FecR domain-containing protein [Bacteroidia bacterium]|nr:FecR domain-containing protein [Bacteroidia bacterium]
MATASIPAKSAAQRSYLSYNKHRSGQTGSFLLPDSSQVWLNANTELQYRQDFQQNRVIILSEGEAFFEVKPDKAHPFTIRTSYGVMTRVLGTSFNVKAYQRLKKVEVAVRTGKVTVAQDQRKFSILERGKLISCRADRSQQLRQLPNADENRPMAAGRMDSGRRQLGRMATAGIQLLPHQSGNPEPRHPVGPVEC